MLQTMSKKFKMFYINCLVETSKTYRIRNSPPISHFFCIMYLCILYDSHKKKSFSCKSHKQIYLCNKDALCLF